MFREFHTLDAATGKAREENTATRLVVAAVVRLKLIVDFLSAGLYEDYWTRYAGCPDRLALYVMVTSLNVICCLMGSQCNSR